MSGSTPAYGEISFNDLQSVFGGTNPIDFNEYYKNELQKLMWCTEVCLDALLSKLHKAESFNILK